MLKLLTLADRMDKAAIERTIDNMNPVDRMSYKPARTAAYKPLQHTTARIKHIILLGILTSDGDAEDSYSAHVTQIRKAGITIPAVVTGGGTYGFGADYGTMQNIARWGGTTGAACVRRSGAKSPVPCPGPVGAARLVTPRAGPRRSPASSPWQARRA